MSKIVARRGSVYDLCPYGEFKTIAEKTGLSATTVSRVFRGEPCSLRTARKICDLCGVRFADLFEIKKEVRAHE